MPDGDKIGTIVADPDFQSLALPDQQKFLSKVDPDFASLKTGEFSTFLARYKGQQNPEQQTLSQLPNPAAQSKQQLMSRAPGLTRGTGRYPTGVDAESDRDAAQTKSMLSGMMGVPDVSYVTPEQAKTSIGVGLLAGGGIAAPAATLGSVVGGVAGEQGLKSAASALGASPAKAEMWGTTGGIIGGLAGAESPAAVSKVGRMIGGKVYMPDGALSPWAEALTHPTKMPETVLRSIIPEKPSFPGASLPSAEEFYAQKGADLTKRGVQQAALDRQAATATKAAAKNALPPDPFSGMTSTKAPIGNAPLPEAALTPQQPIQMVNKFTPPEQGKIVLPGSKPPNVKVTYQSYPREKLYQMAKMGDLNAGLELLRNPKGFELPPNFKYLIEEGAKMPWRNPEK